MIANEKEIKCVIWDLDNTIWDGTLLEDDRVVLKKGIKDTLECLDSRGILNSVASKNNYEDAIKKMREFDIEQYFLYPQINWNAKSTSVEMIKKILNIGMDTIAFIDDLEFERDEVKRIHEEIRCFDSEGYEEITSLKAFNPRFITEDSKNRRKMYLDDKLRMEVEDEFKGTSDEFLATLNLEVMINEAEKDDLERAEELTIRTHQLNATGITYSYEELDYFRISDNYKLLVCELKDKYGSYGKIGIALVEMHEQKWTIKLLLMSCRVMSRGVGSILLIYIMKEAKRMGKELFADFKKTDRNKMMYVTFKFNNFKAVHSNDDGIILFTNDLQNIQDYPAYISVK